MIAVDITSLDMLTYHYVNICLEKEDKFKEDLGSCSTPRFAKILKAVFGEEKFPSDKKESIEMITEKVKGTVKPKKVPAPKVEKKEDDVKVFQIKINPDYLALIPRPNDRDLNNLKKSIQESGLREKIKVLADGTIIDGHSRYQAFQELGKAIPQNMIEIVDLPEDQIERYIFDENVARRHIGDIEKITWAKQFSVQIAEIKSKVKEEKAKKISDIKTGKAEKTTEAPKRATDAIGAIAGVSGAQVRKQEFVERWAPEVLKKSIQDGKTLNEAHKITTEMKDVILRSGIPEVIQQVKDKQISLTDAYEQVKDLPAAQIEKKAGPKAQLLINVRNVFEKCFKGKDGVLTLEGPAQIFYERLEAMINKFSDAGN